MTPKINQKLQLTSLESPKFADSMVEIMDIIKHKGGLSEVIKESSDKRKFTTPKMTFSEMDGKKKKKKMTVAE